MRFVLGIILILGIVSTSYGLEHTIAISNSPAHSGRVVPGLHYALSDGFYEAFVYSGGVSTPIYFHSAYSAGVAKMYNDFNSEVFKGISAGLGAFVYYAQVGYRESTDSALEEASDWTIGPVFRVVYSPVNNLHIGIQGQFGIMGAAIIALSPQELAYLTIGVKF